MVHCLLGVNISHLKDHGLVFNKSSGALSLNSVDVTGKNSKFIAIT